MKIIILLIILMPLPIWANTKNLKIPELMEFQWDDEKSLILMGKKINRELKGSSYYFSWKAKKYQGFSLRGKLGRLKKAMAIKKSFAKDLEILSLFRSTRDKDLLCFKSLADQEFNLHQIIHESISDPFVKNLLLFHFNYQHTFAVDRDGYQHTFYTPLISSEHLDPKDKLTMELIQSLSEVGNSKSCLSNRALVLNSNKRAPAAQHNQFLKQYSRIFPEKVFIYLGTNNKEEIDNSFTYRKALGKKKLLFSYLLSNDKIIKGPFLNKNNFSKLIHHPGQIIFDLYHLGLIKDSKQMRRMLKKVLELKSDQGIVAQNCKRLKNEWQSVCFGLL
ncbi:MAG: hypothetical protein ACO2ZP_03270 [Bacteriovoracaceae bacterium]